jgi:zinc/manganese transport system substrate-binding protein
MSRLSLAMIGWLLAASLAPAAAAPQIKVVASFSILGDLVKNIGGDRVEVATLVGPNGDVHVYTPAPADAKRIAEARLVFINGLGLEGWLPRLVQSSASKADVVTATNGIAPLMAGGAPDPHAWQSVANARIYVANIRDALVAADPADSAVFKANAEGYLTRLDGLETEVKTAIAQIPRERRKVISAHAAFRYFAAAYDVEFIAPLGVSTDSEPSAHDIAAIITQIRAATRSGARIGGTLYSDSLTDEKGDAPTYIDMVRHNIKALTSALDH